MENKLSGKVVLITGGAKRVGAATARHLHACGANLMIHYRASSGEAAALAADLNALRAHSVGTIQADLLNISMLPLIIKQTLQQYGRLDALINNASSFFPTPLPEVTLASWDDLMGSNLKAPLFLAQAAATALKDYKGCIINITDIHSERPLPGYVIYSIAKAGLVGLTRSLAIELGPNVRVNAIAPGPILWPEAITDFDDASRQRIISQTVLARVGDPHDVALAAEFLIVGAPYTTGQVIAVDGGRSINF